MSNTNICKFVISVTCKFIHCTKEDEDHYRKTGELQGVSDPEEKVRRNGSSNSVGSGGNNHNYNNVNGGTSRGSRNNKTPTRAERDVVENDLPICKDFLKGMCDRGPRGNNSSKLLSLYFTSYYYDIW